MIEKIISILDNSYTTQGEFDKHKAAKELLDLYLVSERGDLDPIFDMETVKKAKCEKGYVFEKCERWKTHINGCNFCKKENVC